MALDSKKDWRTAQLDHSSISINLIQTRKTNASITVVARLVEGDGCSAQAIAAGTAAPVNEGQ